MKLVDTCSFAITIGLLSLACGGGSEDVSAGSGAATVVNGPAPKKDPKAPATAPAASSQPKAPAAGGAVCSDSEATAFFCKTSNGKQIAVCASKDLSPTAGYVQYRFGTASQVELAVPADGEKENFREMTLASSLSFSGGGGAYVGFNTGQEQTPSYVVYTAIGQGFDEAGVAVEEQSNLTSVVKCAGKAESDLGDDLFQRAGFQQGEPDLDFTLPATP